MSLRSPEPGAANGREPGFGHTVAPCCCGSPGGHVFEEAPTDKYVSVSDPRVRYATKTSESKPLAPAPQPAAAAPSAPSTAGGAQEGTGEVAPGWTITNGEDRQGLIRPEDLTLPARLFLGMPAVILGGVLVSAGSYLIVDSALATTTPAVFAAPHGVAIGALMLCGGVAVVLSGVSMIATGDYFAWFPVKVKAFQ